MVVDAKTKLTLFLEDILNNISLRSPHPLSGYSLQCVLPLHKCRGSGESKSIRWWWWWCGRVLPLEFKERKKKATVKSIPV